jgi:hypothetical protein
MYIQDVFVYDAYEFAFNAEFFNTKSTAVCRSHF